MTLVEKLQRRAFRPEDHPYRIFEREILSRLQPHHTLLDAGCGRSATLLNTLNGHARALVGVDLVDFLPAAATPRVTLLKSDLNSIQLPSDSVDIAIARSVLEHLSRPLSVYREIFRILKPGGHFVFLTPNIGDYSTVIARLVPNRLHPWIVRNTEGREEADTFPAYYRSNSRRAIRRLSQESGFEFVSLRYVGQYPSYLTWNTILFFLGTCYEKLVARFHALRYLRGWLLVILIKPSKVEG